MLQGLHTFNTAETDKTVSLHQLMTLQNRTDVTNIFLKKSDIRIHEKKDTLIRKRKSQSRANETCSLFSNVTNLTAKCVRNFVLLSKNLRKNAYSKVTPVPA